MHARKLMVLAFGGIFLYACGGDGGGLSMPLAPNANIQIGGNNHAQNSDWPSPLSQSGMKGSYLSDDTDGHITVFAHYVNWYRKTPVFSNWGGVTLLPTLRARPYPPGGLDASDPDPGYDSLDPAVIKKHNEMFLQGGITPLVSWWGRAGSAKESTGDLFLDKYLSIPSPVQIGILYEVTGLLKMNAQKKYDFNDPENVERFVSDIDHLNQKYFSQYPDRFYQAYGKPVVFLWTTDAFTGPFYKAAQLARQKANVYLIGANFALARPWGQELADVVRGFDAISRYTIYDPNLVWKFRGHVSDGYLAQFIQSVLLWTDWLRQYAPQTRLILPMMFSFDKEGYPPVTSTHEEAVQQADTLRSLIESSVAKCGNIETAVLGVSFNEHFEGSSWEPTERYGDSFFSIVRDTFSSSLSVTTGSCTQKR